METTTASGLEGVVVADTRLSEVDGERGRLVVAGHDIERLADGATFEDVAALLWTGALPDAEGRAAMQRALAEGRVAAFERLGGLGDALARVDGMDALRTATGHLSADEGFDAPARLAGALAVFAAAWLRVRGGARPIAPDPRCSHAEDLLRMIGWLEVTPARVAGLAAYLVTVADHGMNASTFAARVVTSTGSDGVSAVVAAIGALKGPLHGGAPGPVLDMLDAVGQPDRAAAWIDGELAAGRRIMGMGHRIYRVRDPRAAVLERAIARARAGGHHDRAAGAGARGRAGRRGRPAAQSIPGGRWRPTSSFIRRCCSTLWGSTGPRSRRPSRSAGWRAGARTCSSNGRSGRLIRPASRYVGPAPA
jgi:citrate synthase